METPNAFEKNIIENESHFENFFDRNMQIFELGFFLTLIFIILTAISLFIPKQRPELVPINNEINTPETTMSRE
jgi:hypothetical protein